MKCDLLAISLIGTDESLRNIDFLENRKVGSFIAINNREKSRDRPSSSKNLVVSDDQGRRRIFKSGPAEEIIECRRHESG